MTERTQRPAPAGFVLAAGYGTRLAPLTDHVPKPLLPVGGRTLLDHALEALGRAGCRRCGVNTHHLSELIAAQVAGRTDADRIMLFHEPEILGTGGALDGAREFLGQGPDFLLHNGDVRCDVDLGALLAAHRRSSAVATLLLVDDPRFNTVAVADDGAVIDIAGLAEAGATTDSRHLTYAGIGMFERDLLEDIGPGFSSLIDPLVRALMASPGSVRSFAPPGVRWDDLGTLPRYLQAIVNEGSGGDSPLAVSAITGHGSDRRFWRLSTTDWSAVAMTSPPDDPEFGRYVAIGRFLAEQDLGAPRILARHDDDRTVLLEDLGTQSLLTATKHLAASGRPDELQTLYEPVVDHLLALQAATPAAQGSCAEATDRILDHAMLRWETDYFRERFLVGHCHLAPETVAGLDEEFETLATAVARQPLVLLHRDFQSQNILLRNGQVGLVDFQGLRLGPLTYDVMSLLCDPYVELSPDLQTDLLVRFCRGALSLGVVQELQLTVKSLRAMAIAAGLQRVMQALGAYGFLGHVKGKTVFLAHIPRALVNLRRLLDELAQLQATGAPDQMPWLPAPSSPSASGGRLRRLVDDLNA